MVDDIVKMQREYFSNIGNLRQDLLDGHANVMYSLACHECSIAGLHRPKRMSGSSYMKFWNYLDIMHNALYTQVKK